MKAKTVEQMNTHKTTVIGFLRVRAEDCAMDAKDLRGVERSAMLTAGELISDMAISLERSA